MWLIKFIIIDYFTFKPLMFFKISIYVQRVEVREKQGGEREKGKQGGEKEKFRGRIKVSDIKEK